MWNQQIDFPDIALDLDPRQLEVVRRYLIQKYGDRYIDSIGAIVDPWVIERRKGNSVRWRNKKTGKWEPGWWPLFVHVPKDFSIIGMNRLQFNVTSRVQNWRGR